MTEYNKAGYNKYLKHLRECEHPLIDESWALTFSEWKIHQKEADEILGLVNDVIGK